MSDTDSTPRTGNKHPTDPDLPSGDLLRYQLRELRLSVQELRETNASQTATLGRIETKLELGSRTIQDHESAIREIRRHGHKATWALITGAGVVAWEFIKHTILGERP